jgi:hypothetical protein
MQGAVCWIVLTFQAALLALLAMQMLPAEHAELLARIRNHMADNLAHLPNYTCRETIERVWAPGGSHHFTLSDRLRLEVAYVSGRELYAWPGATSFDDRTLDEIVGGGGAIGWGNFAMHARVVFTSTAPEFSWGGETQRDGRRVVRFDFHVPLSKSRYGVQTGERPVIVPYTGFLEADADTLDLLRLDVKATELPAELKLHSTGETMLYGQARIGDSDFLLPLSAELSMVSAKGREDRNLTKFEACKQYAGESTIRFDVDENGAVSGQASVPIELAPNLALETALREPIDQAHAARGDLIHATLASDVKKAGHVLAPKGAVLTGRITRIEVRTVRSLVYFGVGVRFHSIEFGGRHGNFSGDVEMAGIGTDYSVAHDPSTGDSVVFIKSKVERLPSGTRLLLRTK